MTNHDPMLELEEYGHNVVTGTQAAVPPNGSQGGVLKPASNSGSIESPGPDTKLRADLKERHVNMIGFSTVLGVGLFLSSGKVLYMAGPLLALIAYLVVGTLMWSTMASMGEMTALFPVKGPMFEFVRRFVDESAGYACAWMMWINCVIVAAAELLAVTEIFRFHVDPAYLQRIEYPQPSVEWTSTEDVDPAAWVVVFLIVILLINLLPVRRYGELEYIFGSVKISFLVALIMINVILNARRKFHADAFWTWETPWGYKSQNFTVKAVTDDNPNGVVYEGSLATFTSLWTAMGTAFFSLMGWDIILLTAPENRDLNKNETVKISSRKIALRVLLLYSLAVFTVGLNVPYNEQGLQDATTYGISGGQNSPFVLSALLEHVPFLPHFLNGFFIFSATTTAINSLYSASRLLHAIASLNGAWPKWGWVEAIRSRLEITKWGVPMISVFASWLVAFLAFLARKPVGNVRSTSSETLGRMITVAQTCTLIIYAMNCFTFLLFYRELEQVVAGERDMELSIPPTQQSLRQMYRRRNNRSYPYQSHLQWIRALYGLVFCLLLILFSGWRTLVPPFNADDFVASYIAIVIFLVLTAAYFFSTRGFNPRNWELRAERFSGLQAIGPIVVQNPNQRRGELLWPRQDGVYAKKAMALLEWIWVWLK